jgi:hypothetical protein
MNRHPLLQAAFDNGSGSCQGKNILGLLSFGMKATCKEPRCANSGVLLYPPSPQNTLQLPASPKDDRPMIAPAARMISSCFIPAVTQKTTFSDDR